MNPDAPPPAAPQPYAPPARVTRGAPSRVLAFLLSLFAPGAGQLYVGRVRRAAGWCALAVIGLPVFGALLPPAARAGLHFVAIPLFAIPFLARPLSALDTLALARRPDARRPGVAVVAVGFCVSLALVMGSAVVTRMFILEAFKIPSGGMMPTLLVGDHVFVDKTAKAFHRGRPIVFRFPEDTRMDFVKRIVAVGGDRLEMRDGHPWINGWEVPHCAVGRGTLPDEGGPKEGEVVLEYLDGESYLTFLDAHAAAGPTGPWTVNANEAFALGDNRRNSHDSRYWTGGKGGGVPKGLVLGEPSFIWLSITEGRQEMSRMGQLLTEPRLPPTLRALQPGLARCLAAKPPLEATVPPVAP